MRDGAISGNLCPFTLALALTSLFMRNVYILALARFFKTEMIHTRSFHTVQNFTGGWGHWFPKAHDKILYYYLYSSIGRVVRAIAESDPKANTENHKIKNAIASGEMINKQSIQKILETHLINLSGKKGIIIDGYPRDIKQVTDFEEKVLYRYFLCSVSPIRKYVQTFFVWIINFYFKMFVLFLSLSHSLSMFLFIFDRYLIVFDVCTSLSLCFWPSSIIKSRQSFCWIVQNCSWDGVV